MDIYILDDEFRRSEVIDRIESLVWTERWQAMGDFELEIISDNLSRQQFLEPFPANDIYMSINESYRVMVVDIIEDTIRQDGQRMLKISGRSIERILADRIVKKGRSVDANREDWVMTGAPDWIGRYMFNHGCRDGVTSLSALDALPFLQLGNLLPRGNIPSHPDIEWVQKPDYLYRALQQISAQYNLGFSLLRNGDWSELYFDCYRGSDRTSEQTELSPVVFDAQLDAINIDSDFRSMREFKNVAYVYSNRLENDVYDEWDHIRHRPMNSGPSGFKRRNVLVKAERFAESGITLAENARKTLWNPNVRYLHLLDGNINPEGQYKYDVDYHIGDIVEFKDNQGVSKHKRVTEYIFTTDGNGDRSFPTFSEPNYIEEVS